MTWADLGLRYNIEPFRKESVQRYVTLPGAAADQYVNEANLGFNDTLLEHLDVWKAVSPTPFPSFYHNRNFKGGDALRYYYGNIQRMGAKAGPDGVVRLKQPTPTTITFMADEREAPTKDEGERPPKMKHIRSLAEEEMDEESDEEPLMTNRKRKGVNQPESRQEPFLLAIGGQAGPGGEEGGTRYLELPDYFNRYGGPPKEKQRARSSPSPKADMPVPDIPLSEQVQEPRVRRPARATLPSAGLGGLDTSQLDPDKLKEGVLGKPQRETPAEQKGGSGERPQGPKLARCQSWSDMVEADDSETARAKAETARARAEWEAKKKSITGGSLNPVSEQPVELPSQLVQETFAVVRKGEVGVEPARKIVKRDDKGAAGESNERAIPEGGTVDSQATTDKETVKAQFKISPVKAGGTEAGVQVEEGPGRAKEAGEDAALKKQGGAEGEELEEEEEEPMEGLEEERPAEKEGVKGEKPGVEERERGEKERVKKEKKDQKKKDKKKKKGQKKEGEKSRSGKSPLGEGTVKKGGPDVAMKMALEIPDPLIQAGVARTLRLNRGKKDSKDSDSTSGDEEEGEDEERGRAKKERAQEKEKYYGHIFGGGARTRQTARITAGSALLKQPPTGAPPTESFGEATPELEEGVGGESSEDRKIEGLKATKAQLDEELRFKQIWIAEKERKLRLEREEAAQVVKEQRAIEKKLPEGVEKAAAEIGEEILGPGVGEKQAKGGEEEEGDTLKSERTGEREELEEEGEAEDLKGERAGEREGLGDEQPGEEQNDEVMEEGQAPETEYQTIELAELLTEPQRKERRERQKVKIPERKPLGVECDIQLPDAPPPVLEEMMETEEPVSKSQERFQGRETWDVTFKVGDKVRIEQMMQNARGEMEEPIETEFLVKRFFDIMETWPPNIRSFKF
jgi:hypothetical protein